MTPAPDTEQREVEELLARINRFVAERYASAEVRRGPTGLRALIRWWFGGRR